MGRVSCELCGVSCTSPRSLCEHVAGQKHRAVMLLVSPEKQEHFERVQYFVDTYLKDIPILGLEYVVEEQVGSSYLYTCMLCNKEYEWQEMVAHVADLEHTDNYVRRHHHELKTTSTNLTKEEENLLLLKIAKTIHTEFGHGVIRLKKSNAANPDVIAVPSPMEGIKNNGALPSTGNDLQTEHMKERLRWDSVPQEKESDLKMLTQGEECTEVNDIAEYQKYACTPCSVTCSSAVALCQHIIGNKHKKKLLLPQEQNDIKRLSYFLNAHMKKDPIVGLEYVMEVKQGPLYKFSCQLCSVVDVSLMKIVAHITDPNHTELYIWKHYGDLFPPLDPTLHKAVHAKALRDISVRVIKLQGRKEIQVKNTTTGGPTESALFPGVDSKTRKAFEDMLPTKPEGDSKTRKAVENTLPSKPEGDSKTRKAIENTLPSKPEGDSKTRKAVENMLPSKPEGDSKTRKAVEDMLPSKPEGDSKTRKALEDTLPSKREGERKIRKAFEDTLLSKREGDRKTRKAFEDMLPSKREGDRKTRKAFEDTLPTKREGDRKTRKTFENTLPSKREGDRKTRKAYSDTLPSKRECDRKTRKAFEDTLPSKHKGDRKTRKAFEDTLPSEHESRSSHSKWRPLSYRGRGLDDSHESYHYSTRPKVSKSDDPLLAKRSRLSFEGDWDALPSRPHISEHRSSHYNDSHAIRMDCTTAMQELEFRTNYEFLKYLSNFVIANDEDAVFIRTITQNCIRAMTNFQAEEAEKQKTTYQSETPLAHTSRTAQEIPGFLENKTESHSWVSETTLLKETSNPPSDSMPKNEVTNFFFSSIKNMDESEVVGVFQKIATTNPEFQGMDIPSVIRFLKDSGRLKKP